MSGPSEEEEASKHALELNKSLAGQYYDVALPAMATRMGSIDTSLANGAPAYLGQAYQGQRAGLTEGLTARGDLQQAQLMAGSKKAMSGGNAFASLHPADIGAQLANALYGSKFQEGQANLDQQFNLMNMALGGAGSAGSGALEASRQQLGTIGYMPAYNQTAANVWGGLAGAASIYGAANKAGLFSGTPPPTGTSPGGAGGGGGMT